MGTVVAQINSGRLIMKRAIALLAVAVVGVLAVASLASGKTSAPTLKFKAAINVAQVVPHPKGTNAGASGTFKATLTGTTLKWTLTYSHLTGPAVAAHIHLGARGKNGIALVALCGPCKSPLSGSANSVTDDVAALMSKGGAYVNVHTDKNPEGEIRGEITLVH
jgi:CHRD domain-containing protein